MKRNLFSLFVLFFFCLASQYVWGANTVGDTWTSGNYTYKILTAAKATGSTAANRGTCSVKAKDTSISGTLSINEYVGNGSYYYNVTEVAASGFSGCSSVTSISIGSNVTTIGGSAFSGCSSLATITIPPTVTRVETSAFNNCSALTRVNYQKSSSTTTLTYVDDWASIDFANDKANPLYYAKNLYVVKTTSTMPALSKVTSLGFKNSPTITEIKKYAFYNCTALTSVTIPYTVTSIGSSAFNWCSNITTVKFGTNANMPCNVTSIAAGAFSNCTSIANVHCWGGLEKWMNINFATQVAAPFYASTAATKKFYIDNVETTEIIIPDNILSIDTAAFAGMSNLTKISLPATTTNVHRYAFAKCTGLQEIISLAVEAPTIEIANTFESVPTNIPLFVPSEAAKASYEAASTWKTFKNIIPFSGYCGDNLAWSYSWSTHTLEIAGEGEMFNYNSTHAPWYDFAGDIQTIIIGENVTKIGSMAFRYCNNVTALYYNAIKATVSYTASSSASNQSFYELGKDGAGFTCYVGPQVTALPDGMFCPAYQGGQYGVSVYGRPKLVSIVFAEQGACTTIGRDAFLRATDLTQITLPATITSIGNSAFDNCSNLTRTDFMGTIAQWCGITFGNSSANPVYHSHNLYIDKSLVTELVFPEDISSIGAYCFNDMSQLESITCNSQTPPATPNGDPFSNNIKQNKNITLYIPQGTLAAYQAADPWKEFVNIQEMKVTVDLADNTDNSELLSLYDTKIVDVNLTRSLSNASYNTLCLPFAVDAATVEEKFGERTKIAELTGSSIDGEYFNLEFTKRSAIQAGVPYLIQPANDDVVNPSFENVEINATPKTSKTDNVDFVGIYSPYQFDVGNQNYLFVGANNTLYWAEAGTMNGLRAYFVLKPNSPAHVGMRTRVVMHNETTSLNTMKTANVPAKMLYKGHFFIMREKTAYNALGTPINVK
ncbi:MAG: leucine-rich repeat domain-containing protein [Paludibacteraceae bacterium]|nr:leucine-rich repeat domain-containing protein [Paludibacteraceae bacterium]